MRPRLNAAVGILAAALLIASCQSEGPAAPEDEPARKEVFRPSDAPAGSSGSLVATADGEVVTCQGWGEADHETGAAAGCTTVYDIGSVTKTITATAVLKLQMQGRLHVTDPITRYFDGVPSDKRPITIKHLLTHTAGVSWMLSATTTTR